MNFVRAVFWLSSRSDFWLFGQYDNVQFRNLGIAIVRYQVKAVNTALCESFIGIENQSAEQLNIHVHNYEQLD